MGNPNVLIIFLFSIIDNIIFIGLLAKFRNNKHNYMITDLLVIITVSIITVVFTQLDFTPHAKLILISILLLLATFLYDLRSFQRVLAIVLYYFILVVSELLVTFLASYIFYKSTNDFQAKYTYFYLGLISKLVSFLIYALLNSKFLKTKIILPRILNFVMILMLSLSVVSMVLLFYSSLNLSLENTIFVLFLICLFIFFISIGTIVVFFNANDFYINLQKETTKKIYNKSYEKFLANSEIRNDTLSKLWHDIGNHIKVLEKIKETDKDDYMEYINSIKNRFKSIPNTINTGNKIINVILNDKYSEAILHGIDFDIKAIAPPKINIEDIDLSSILFNTIDNAIEACLNCSKENRYIYLELYPDGNFLCYKIKNSYNRTQNNSHNKIFFSKKQYISSGYGLSIINDIVNKYDGYIDIKKDNKEFSVTIILHL